MLLQFAKPKGKIPYKQCLHSPEPTRGTELYLLAASS